MNNSPEVAVAVAVPDTSTDDSLWATNRVEALSDGVFAIVMTLLVLELKVPHLPRDASAAEVWHGFEEIGPVFFSYFVTFAISGTFWFWHHQVFHQLRHINGALFALNLAFLSFVSLLPFSTAMLGAFKLRQPISLACYFGNLFAMALILSVFWQYAQRSRFGLLAPARDPKSRRQFTLILASQTLACIAALIAVALNPGLAMNIYVLVLVTGNVIARRTAGR